MDKYIDKALKNLEVLLPANCEAQYKQVRKNNGVLLDGFIIKEEGNDIAPTFYLSEQERVKYSPEEFAELICDRFRKEQERGIDFDIANFTDLDWVKSRIMFEIVNRNMNAGSNLANIPITNDLMITFKVSVSQNANIKVTNDHLNIWGNVTTEELLRDAQKNSVLMDRATFRSISEVLIDILLDEYRHQYPDVQEDELRNRIKKEMFEGADGMLFVLSTQRQSNAAMLYPDMLDNIKKQLNDNLIILPSSIHEILIMKETDALSIGLDNVKAMVSSVNRDVVMQDNAEDYLSDELLIYDGELKQLDIDSKTTDDLIF